MASSESVKDLFSSKISRKTQQRTLMALSLQMKMFTWNTQLQCRISNKKLHVRA